MQSILFNSINLLNYKHQTKTTAAFMKKIILVISVVLIATVKLSAQWTTAGSITSTTNNVGIGTSAPNANLQVIGNAILGRNSNVAFPVKLDITSGASNQDARIDFGYYTTFDATGYMMGRWGVDGSFRISDYPTGTELTRFMISSTGSVGMGGITAPTALLHIKGSGSTNATTALLVQNSAGAAAFRVLDNGNVGIGVAVGTTFPQNKLGIYATGADALGAYVTLERPIGTGLIGGIRFASGNLNAANSNLPYTAGIESYGTGGTDQMDLRFFTSYGPGQQNIERIRIMQTGQVGIGTSSPVTKLDVVGLGAGNIDFQTTGRVKIYGSAPGVSFNDGTSERGFLGWAGSGIANHAVGVYTATGGWNTLNVMTNGAIAIGAQATNTNAKLDVTGNIFANNKVLIGMSGLSAADYTAKITPYALAVNGDAIFNKVRVKLYASWPDFVFEEKYGLLPLSELEQFIKTNKHLPDVPSSADVEKDGIDVGDNQTILLKKVEELTLYLIEQNKKLALQGNEINNLKLQLSKLEKK